MQVHDALHRCIQELGDGCARSVQHFLVLIADPCVGSGFVLVLIIPEDFLYLTGIGSKGAFGIVRLWDTR